MNIIVSNSREINAAVPVTVFILVSLSLYGLYDIVSGEDESSTLDLIDPVWDYTHKTEIGYGSVTGGFVYRGQDVPLLYGKYVYGDFMVGSIWSLEMVNGEAVNELVYDSRADTSFTGDKLSISSFGESESGELFFSDRNTGRLFTFNQSDSGEIVIEAFKPDVSIPMLIGIYNAGDSSDRLFLIEQAGKIHSIQANDSSSDVTLFLNITDKVESANWEQGLLGLAFDPDYEKNGIFFVSYTTLDEGTLRLSKMTNSTEEVLMEISQPYANHNGGHLAFGPDGFLYFALGDGGKYNDAFNNAQNLETLKGSILRLDVSGEKYTIPSDNPFVGNTDGYREEIFAYGFRNPWMFSFDRENGDLWAGYVGQDEWEEVDIVVSGGNYGWAFREGSHCFNSPFEHYDGHSCNEVDGVTFSMFIYERVLLNFPLMFVLIVSIIVSTRYKIQIG